ncbi:MAG: CvpA family protein [Cardiobacterium sp.]|jgi:colicin V production protein|nr:MAG: CvpA family protein [Cardiobacterium sp.]
MDLNDLNWIDVALGGALAISALVGLMRGFLKEVLSLIAWGAALYAAWLFAQPVAETYVSKFLSDSYIAYIAAFGGIFIGVLFLIGVVNLLISQVLKATGLGFLDRLLGLILGTVRGVLIGALIIFGLKFMVGTPNQLPMWRDSTLAPYFESMATWGYEQLSPKVREWINQNLKGDKKSTNTAARPTAHDANSGVLHATPGVEEPSLNGLESTQ